MVLIFDIFEEDTIDAMLAVLRNGRNLQSNRVPVRMMVNSTGKELMAVAATNGGDVCLGPFSVSEVGLEEATYDALHCLEHRGMLERFDVHLRGAPETRKSLGGEARSLDVALRVCKSLRMTQKETDWRIVPVIKERRGNGYERMRSGKTPAEIIRDQADEIERLKAAQATLSHEVSRYRDSLREIEGTSHKLPESVLDFIDAVLDHDGRKGLEIGTADKLKAAVLREQAGKIQDFLERLRSDPEVKLRKSQSVTGEAYGIGYDEGMSRVFDGLMDEVYRLEKKVKP